MSKSWVVLKFGGTSVSSRSCWETIAGVVEARLADGLAPLVVCSAASGVSDELERLLEEAGEGSPKEALERIRARHSELTEELAVDWSEIASQFEELDRLVTGAALIREVTPRLRARVMAQGELMSTRLGAAYLKARGLSVSWRDARDLLRAVPVPFATPKQCFLHAVASPEPDGRLKEQLAQDANGVLITQGFIAGDESGDTVLLGRGGSDVSAAYFAAKLGAARCEIWTDVPGMYTANPRRVPTAHLIKSLDYSEAQEIASSGAKVLHPRCLVPVRRQGIPLTIHWLARPEMEGTAISSDAEGAGAQVKAISSRGGVTLISMESVDMWHQVGFLASVFDCFKRHGVSIDLVSTSETNVTVTLDRGHNALDERAFEALVADLGEFCQPRVVDQCAFVSLVGRDIRAIIPKIAPALEVFEEQRVYMVSQAANDLNLTFVVDEEQAERLVRDLHSQLFSQRKRSSILGPTWRELTEGAEGKSDRARPAPWWRTKRDELVAIARKASPVYVYDGGTLRAQIDKVRSLESVDRAFYSVKANSNASILKEVERAGLGFECVSPGEIDHVLATFPGMEPERIIFTPNFASREEYERGFSAGVNVTLDNLYPLSAWPEAFKGRRVFVRIDPGKGRGHHEFVHTAGYKSKFGVSPDQFDELQRLVKKSGAKVVGLHAHVGSNIFETDTWSRTAMFLAEVARRFPDAKYLDLGGGLGVVEKPGGAPLDMREVDAKLKDVKKANPDYEIWIEPGRFIAAEAGVLLARVTQLKTKGEYHYVGIDAGMNTLIRPALYGSYHEIVNLSRLDEKARVTADIVGPICESGDVLGYDRSIAVPRDGDVILIGTAGAYGRVMSSSYNLRIPAGEHYIEANG